MGEKCTLTLVAEELESISKLQEVVQAYAKKLFSKSENSTLGSYVISNILDAYGNVPFESTHWILQTDGILEKGEGKSKQSYYPEQEALVDSLVKESGANWLGAELRDTTTAIFLSKIAAGKDNE